MRDRGSLVPAAIVRVKRIGPTCYSRRRATSFIIKDGRRPKRDRMSVTYSLVGSSTSSRWSRHAGVTGGVEVGERRRVLLVGSNGSSSAETARKT
jgi:hypothetical protein